MQSNDTSSVLIPTSPQAYPFALCTFANDLLYGVVDLDAPCQVGLMAGMRSFSR